MKIKHNSNRKTQQVSLDGVVIQEYAYFFMGIVSANFIGLNDGSWFNVLDNNQIMKVNRELKFQILERCKRKKKKVERKVKKVVGWL
jgi:hypothetical protein